MSQDLQLDEWINLKPESRFRTNSLTILSFSFVLKHRSETSNQKNYIFD